MGIVLLTSILITTIVYSSFSTQLQISGEAIVRSDNDIRITNVKVLSQTNNAYETYNNKYTKDTISMFVTLPSNSSITYEIEVTNKSNIDYVISELIEKNNTSINYKIVKEKVIIDSNSKYLIEFIIENNSNQEQKDIFVLNGNFMVSNAKFVEGTVFSEKIKRLAGTQLQTTYPYLTTDNNIKQIVRSSNLPNIELTNDNIISTSSSSVPIYAWFDNGTIYYFSEFSNPYLNENAIDMFRELRSVEYIDLSTINTSKTQIMHAMFMDAHSLKSLDLSNFDTSNVYGNTGMSYMFSGCTDLTELDLSSFNTSKITSMYAMFERCTSLNNLNISSFDTSKVTNMGNMFSTCRSLTSLNLSNFNTSNVTSMLSMFIGCTNIQTLNLMTFDTKKVENMSYMFNTCSNLVSIYVGTNFITSSVNNSDYMFTNSTRIVGKLGTVYNSNYVDKSYAHIDGGVDNPGYFTTE